MRIVAYAVATLVAVAIMFAIANTGTESANDASQTASATASATSAKTVSANTMTEAGTLVIAVPEMHCEFACFPKVKEALEATGAVQAVELAEQKEQGTIDNRQVVVKYDAGFDPDAAIKMLETNGFADSALVH